MVIVAGSGDGGLRVQTNLTVKQVDLNGGTISGYGNLIVTVQMLWAGGTMNNASVNAPDGTNVVGRTTIMPGAGLFLIGTTQDWVPILNRPLDIFGKVGWVGCPGDVYVTINGNAQFTNNEQMASTALKDIPVVGSSAWNALKGGYGSVGNTGVVQGDVVTMAMALRTLIGVGVPNPPARISANGWLGTAQFVNRDALPAFFATLPAIVRASLENGLRRGPQNANLLNVIDSLTSSNYKVQTMTAFLRGLGPPRSTSGGASGQFGQATVWAWTQMAAGMIAGYTAAPFIAAWHLAQGVASLAQGLAAALMSPVTTMRTISNGIAWLMTEMQNVEFAQVARALFPEWATVYDLYAAKQLVSFEGGFALGKAVWGTALQIALTIASGGIGGFIRGLTSTVSTTVQATLATTRLVWGGTVAVARLAASPGVVIRATGALIRALPSTGLTLAARMAAPFNPLWNRARSYGSILRQSGRVFGGRPTLIAGEFEIFGEVRVLANATRTVRSLAQQVFGRELPQNVQIFVVRGGGIQLSSGAGGSATRLVNGATVVNGNRTVIFITEASVSNPVLLVDEIGHLLVSGTNSNFHHRVSFRMLQRAVRRKVITLTAEQETELAAALAAAGRGL